MTNEHLNITSENQDNIFDYLVHGFRKANSEGDEDTKLQKTLDLYEFAGIIGVSSQMIDNALQEGTENIS